ncbi:MAG: ribonuclease Y [Acidobacteriota bacterium]|nr:ribonuclease Y [Acidobacteriota bacterium]
MDSFAIAGVVSFVGAVTVCVVWVVTRKRIATQTIGQAKDTAARLLREARREAETHHKEAELAAKQQAHTLLQDCERRTQERREELASIERQLARRTEELKEQDREAQRTETGLRKREDAIDGQERKLADDLHRCEEVTREKQQALQRVSGLTAEEAKDLVIKQIELDARRDAANLIKRLEAEARENAAEKAKQIITQAIQRSAPDHAIETTVSVVDLPSDDLKGRIIGREGRNIRALEQATGVELIVDDTPGAIILSSFDPFRREVAKQAIERLISDGRIHPARIEEVVEKVKTELDGYVLKEGEAAAFELGLFDMHPEIHKLMGRLKFRTSYGQNVLNHSKEVAYLAGIMAREVGLDAQTTIRGAFVHDIGKAIDRDLQGTHLTLGIDFLRQHGESEAVIDAMAAHHMDIDWPSLESMLVQAADAISAARPGARRDILESYIKRLEQLEGIADSFDGVSKAFALQAGREVRIMVESEKVSDEEAVWLSKDIAKRVEHELQYPGQIKVTVIRETRAVDYAR